MTTSLGLFFTFFILTPFSFGLYVDEIAVPSRELWQAAEEVVRDYGLKKQKAEKRLLETDWVEDQVVRSRGLLKKVASQTYRRRYRMEVQLRALRPAATEIRIEGTFQERPLGESPSLVWRKVKPALEDLQLEVQLFRKILRRLEENRQGGR